MNDNEQTSGSEKEEAIKAQVTSHRPIYIYINEDEENDMIYIVVDDYDVIDDVVVVVDDDEKLL
jgi:hypothetical protein